MILVSDNGASGEGGPDGSVNENKFFNGIADDLKQNLAMIDELGGTKTYNHYPTGWAMAFNTPFKMWKRYEFDGGTCDPCIIAWPTVLGGHGGELRHQCHHAVDIVPTILDLLGMTPPDTIKGHAQTPFDGVSMRYTDDYPGQPPYRFTGGIVKRAAVDVSGEPYLDLEREAAAMLAREWSVGAARAFVDHPQAPGQPRWAAPGLV